MSSEQMLVDGPYQVDALGSVTIVSRGSGTYIRAAGDTGDLSLESQATANLTCGPALVGLINKGPAQGQIVLLAGAAGEILQAVGQPVVGPALRIESDKITLSIGPPGVGTSIELAAASITLTVAKTSLKLTPTGITEEVITAKREVTPVGHTLTAAETKLEVAVQGINESGPIKQEKFEACATGKQTLANESTDAMHSIKAGILMVG